MAEVRCVDGSVLSVLPVPVLDRRDVPYEVTLRLLRDGQPFGEVGERCGFFLATTAARLRAATAAGSGFPASAVEAGLRAWAADVDHEPDAAWADFQRYLPRDRDLLAFRARDPDDLSQAGELRVGLREERSWLSSGAAGGRGRWQHRCLAVLEAWGEQGKGLRAVLTSEELLAFLDRLVADCAAVGAAYDGESEALGLRRPAG